MRAVAERTGVTPMALYPHVGSKAALLDGMLGRVVGQTWSPPERPRLYYSSLDWRQRLRDDRCTWRRGTGAPASVGRDAGFSRPSVATADAVRAVDLFYTALLDAGVPPGEVPRMERLVSYVRPRLRRLGGGRPLRAGRESYVRVRRGQLGDAPLPGHKAVIRWLNAPMDWDAEFEADVDDLVRLVEATAARGSVPDEQQGADNDHRHPGEPGDRPGGGGPRGQDLPRSGPEA